MSEDPPQDELPVVPPLHIVGDNELPPQINQSPGAMAHEEHGYSMHTPVADLPEGASDAQEWGVKVTNEEPPEITPEQAQTALKRIDEMIDANNAGEHDNAVDKALHHGRRFLELYLTPPGLKPGGTESDPSHHLAQ